MNLSLPAPSQRTHGPYARLRLGTCTWLVSSTSSFSFFFFGSSSTCKRWLVWQVFAPRKVCGDATGTLPFPRRARVSASPNTSSLRKPLPRMGSEISLDCAPAPSMEIHSAHMQGELCTISGSRQQFERLSTHRVQFQLLAGRLCQLRVRHNPKLRA
jgi:hypothetical protein